MKEQNSVNQVSTGLSFKRIYLKVKNLSQSIDFYCNQLGLKFLEIINYRGQIFVSISLTGNYDIQLLLSQNSVDKAPHRLGFIELDLDPEAFARELVESGIEVFADENYVDFFRFKDADNQGLQIEMFPEYGDFHEHARLNQSQYSLKEVITDRAFLENNTDEFNVVLSEISLDVKNSVLAKDFYTRHLGFKLIREVNDGVSIKNEFYINESPFIKLSLVQDLLSGSSLSKKLSFSIVPLYEHYFGSVYKKLTDSGIEFFYSDGACVVFEDPDFNAWTLINPHPCLY